MSNAYLNQLLFGQTKRIVNETFVSNLLPHMFTTQWIQNTITTSRVEPPSVGESLSLPVKPVIASSFIPTSEQHHTKKQSTAPQPIVKMEPIVPKMASLVNPPQKKDSSTPQINRPTSTQTQKRFNKSNTLFWSIYEHEFPKDAFLCPSAANMEIETRLKIVESFKNTPKRLKDTNSKLTMEETQRLLGSMLIAREDCVEFCIAYSVYYGKHILIVYPNTYRIFSPSVNPEIEDDDHVIILYASKDGLTKKVAYSLEANPTKELADNILRRPTILKAQSNYKTGELEQIAERMHIPSKTAEGKRRKKEELYNQIRVAIHNDMHFLDETKEYGVVV